MDQEREMDKFEKTASSKIKHFDGDIPIEELMKIQFILKTMNDLILIPLFYLESE